MSWVCVNGEFVLDTDAKVSVWDHGYLYGDGLFETMRAYGGKIFALDAHLKRLRQGAKCLRLEINYADKQLQCLLQETIWRNDLASAYIRLTYSRGAGPIGLDPDLCPTGTLVIMAKPSQVAPVIYSEGISLGVSPIRRNHPAALSPAIKSLNFGNNILAKIWAKEHGYDDALMLNQDGWLTETTVSNLFFVKGAAVFTPALNTGILAGVTRECIINSTKVEQGMYALSQLLDADEIFLTNSGSEVIPVCALDGRIVGNGKPGMLTKQIHSDFQQLVREKLQI